MNSFGLGQQLHYWKKGAVRQFLEVEPTELANQLDMVPKGEEVSMGD
jgi:hypothetical protein